jgi:hypothetical protein
MCDSARRPEGYAHRKGLNITGKPTSSSLSRATGECASFPIEAAVVDDLACDPLFTRALAESLAGLSRSEKARLAPVIGEVAEDLAPILLEPFGFIMVTDSPGRGRHGVDLQFLSPESSRVVSVEVKGTLRPGHWPRLSRGTLTQMSAAWLDKPDNPGMASWDLNSADVYTAILLINFADLAFRVMASGDLLTYRPIVFEEQLGCLDWLDEMSVT